MHLVTLATNARPGRPTLHDHRRPTDHPARARPARTPRFFDFTLPPQHLNPGAPSDPCSNTTLTDRIRRSRRSTTKFRHPCAHDLRKSGQNVPSGVGRCGAPAASTASGLDRETEVRHGYCYSARHRSPCGCREPCHLALTSNSPQAGPHHHRPVQPSMIARHGPRTRLPDARSRAELAGTARPLRHRQGRRDPDAATRGRCAAPHQPPTNLHLGSTAPCSAH